MSSNCINLDFVSSRVSWTNTCSWMVRYAADSDLDKSFFLHHTNVNSGTDHSIKHGQWSRKHDVWLEQVRCALPMKADVDRIVAGLRSVRPPPFIGILRILNMYVILPEHMNPHPFIQSC